MEKINKLIDELQDFIDRVINKAEAPVKKILKFVKKHRKLIFVIVIVYLAFKYLFGEEENDDEE